MKFQIVYRLLYYVKIKLFCTGLRQILQGVYKPVDNFNEISKCLPSFVLRQN